MSSRGPAAAFTAFVAGAPHGGFEARRENAPMTSRVQAAGFATGFAACLATAGPPFLRECAGLFR